MLSCKRFLFLKIDVRKILDRFNVTFWDVLALTLLRTF